MKIDYYSIGLSLISTFIFYGIAFDAFFLEPLFLYMMLLPWIGTFAFYTLKSIITLGLKNIFPNNGVPVVFSFFNKNNIKFDNRAVHLFNLLINFLLLPLSYWLLQSFPRHTESELQMIFYYTALSFWWHAQFAVWLNMLPIFGSDSYMFLKSLLSKNQLKGVSIISSVIFGAAALILMLPALGSKLLGFSLFPIIITFAMSSFHSFMKNLALDIK